MLFPQKVRVSLPIQNAEIASIASVGGGTPSGFWFQKGYGLNNLYAWDPAITAHQPRGWNQWIAMYDYAYVVSQNVYVKLNNTATTNDAAGLAALYLSELGTAEVTGAAAYYDNLERVRDPDLNGVWKHFNSQGGGSSQWTFLKKKFYTRYGQTDADIGNFTFKTDGTGAPTIQREFHVFIRMPQAAGSRSMLYEVYSTCDIIFFEPKNVVGS